MTIGENIKEIRKSKKMKQTFVANEIGKSVRMLQKYENDEVRPSMETIRNIAKVFDVNPLILLDPSELADTEDLEILKNLGIIKDGVFNMDSSYHTFNIYKNLKNNKTTYVIPKDNGDITYNEAILGITKYINYLANEENYVVGSEDYEEIIKSVEEFVRGKILIAKKNRGEKIK